MNRISFNPQFSLPNFNINYSKQEKNIPQDNLQQISELPSFGRYIPVKTYKVCRKMLLDAKTERGTLRFPTNEEIHTMVRAIADFKTKASKSDLLNILLYGDLKSHKQLSQLTANNLTEYFTLLSGAPAETQKAFAFELAKETPEKIISKLNLLRRRQMHA